MRNVLVSPVRRVLGLLMRDRAARRQAEQDAPADLGSARSRPSGGEPAPAAPDTHSTTGTTHSEEFVGRAGGDDPGDLREGAERRAERDREPGAGDA